MEHNLNVDDMCLSCQQKGFIHRLCYFQINYDEKIIKCESEYCIYPFENDLSDDDDNDSTSIILNNDNNTSTSVVTNQDIANVLNSIENDDHDQNINSANCSLNNISMDNSAVDIMNFVENLTKVDRNEMIDDLLKDFQPIIDNTNHPPNQLEILSKSIQPLTNAYDLQPIQMTTEYAAQNMTNDNNMTQSYNNYVNIEKFSIQNISNNSTEMREKKIQNLNTFQNNHIELSNNDAIQKMSTTNNIPKNIFDNNESVHPAIYSTTQQKEEINTEAIIVENVNLPRILDNTILPHRYLTQLNMDAIDINPIEVQNNSLSSSLPDNKIDVLPQLQNETNNTNLPPNPSENKIDVLPQLQNETNITNLPLNPPENKIDVLPQLQNETYNINPFIVHENVNLPPNPPDNKIDVLPQLQNETINTNLPPNPPENKIGVLPQLQNETYNINPFIVQENVNLPPNPPANKIDVLPQLQEEIIYTNSFIGQENVNLPPNPPANKIDVLPQLQKGIIDTNAFMVQENVNLPSTLSDNNTEVSILHTYLLRKQENKNKHPTILEDITLTPNLSNDNNEILYPTCLSEFLTSKVVKKKTQRKPREKKVKLDEVKSTKRERKRKPKKVVETNESKEVAQTATLASYFDALKKFEDDSVKPKTKPVNLVEKVECNINLSDFNKTDFKLHEVLEVVRNKTRKSSKSNKK